MSSIGGRFRMSKERLEEIRNFSNLPFEERIKLTKESIEKELKESDYYTPKNVSINTKYFLEIIEQAERVQELEEENERLCALNIATTHELNYVDKINKRYREALEFYANEDNWVYGKVQHIVQREKARKALESEE